MAAPRLDSGDVLRLLTDSLSPLGFESYALKVGWYNAVLPVSLRLAHPDQTLAVVVLSTPDMFEAAFLPYLEQGLWGGAADPIDQCVKHTIDCAVSQVDHHVRYVVVGVVCSPSKASLVFSRAAGGGELRLRDAAQQEAQVLGPDSCSHCGGCVLLPTSGRHGPPVGDQETVWCLYPPPLRGLVRHPSVAGVRGHAGGRGAGPAPPPGLRRVQRSPHPPAGGLQPPVAGLELPGRRVSGPEVQPETEGLLRHQAGPAARPPGGLEGPSPGGRPPPSPPSWRPGGSFTRRKTSPGPPGGRPPPRPPDWSWVNTRPRPPQALLLAMTPSVILSSDGMVIMVVMVIMVIMVVMVIKYQHYSSTVPNT